MADQNDEQLTGPSSPGAQPTRPVFQSPDADRRPPAADAYTPVPSWLNQTQPVPGHPGPGAQVGYPGQAPTAAPAAPPSHQIFGAPYQDPYQAPGQAPGYGPGQAPGQGLPPGQPPGTGLPPRRERRGPGWGGVVAVSAGAAVLSSLLTAGIVGMRDDNGTTGNVRPAAAASSQSAPPLVTSNGGSLPDWGAVANAVEPSVVAVQVEAAQGSGEGSGVILDTSGRVLTNNHVVSEGGGGGRITVVLSDGRAYPAAIVGTDPSTDLAVIKINASVSGLKPATFGDSAAVHIGDPVMAAGNPLGLADTVTTGIVSAVNRPVSTQGQGGQGGSPFGQTRTDPVVTNAIQTDAAINPGNSGGALVDAGGRVIGVTSSIASLSSSGSGQSGNIGLGFAIPINEAKQVADQLVKTGKVQHAYMGVGLQDSSVEIDGAQREAAVLGSVNPGTPAAQAGLKAKDAVIAFNGQRIDSSDSLVGSIRALMPGTKVTLTIVRDGKKLDIDITLGTRPASAG